MLKRVLFLFSVLLMVPAWSYATIVDKLLFNKIVYLLDSTAQKIYRYDTGTQAFLSEVAIAGTGVPSNFDSADGSVFFVAAGRDIRQMVIDSDGIVSETIVRRMAGTIRSLDVNGGYLVVAFGETASEIWSIRLSDGDVVSRQPLYATSVPEEDREFYPIPQLSFVSAANRYFLRLESQPAIYVDFDPTTGLLSNYDATSQLDVDTALDVGDRMFFLPEFNLAVDAGGIAYSIDGATFTSLYNRATSGGPEPFPFFRGGEGITTDGAVDAVASDGTAFYAALTIDNSCNTRVEGTQVSVNTYDPSLGGFVTHNRVVDFDEALDDIAVVGGTLYGFFITDSENGVLDVVSKPAGTADEIWVDTTFDPNTETFEVLNSKVQPMGPGSDKIIINIDEGCKHYLVEYDVTNGAYSNQTEVNLTLVNFTSNATNNVLYWGFNFDNDLFDVENSNNISIRIFGQLNKLLFVETGVLIQAQVGESGEEVLIYTDGDFNEIKQLDLPTDAGPWTEAVWDYENDDVLFVASDKLYRLNFAEWLALPDSTAADDETAYAAVIEESLHFGVLTATTVNSAQMVNNVKGNDTRAARDLFYTAGNFFDLESDGLLIDDAAQAVNDLAVWTGSAFYSTLANAELGVEKWTFTLSDAKILELVGLTTQAGTNLALTSATVNGTVTPVLITRQSDQSLSFVTNLDESVAVVENNISPEEEALAEEVEEQGGEGGETGGATGQTGDPSLNCGSICQVGGGSGSGGALNLFFLLSLVLLGAARRVYGRVAV